MSKASPWTPSTKGVVSKTTKFEVDYYDEEEPSMTTFSQGEEEYLDFLEQFGHVDFFLLEWTPIVHSVKEL